MKKTVSVRKPYKRTKPNIQRRTEERVTLTPIETCPITGMGLTSTYRSLKANQMPHIKVGPRFLIPKAALLRWLENCGE